MEKESQLSSWNKWKRPKSVPYPNTWHRYTIKSKTGKIYNIKIVDLTPDRFEDALEFMMKLYHPNEPLFISVNFSKDEVSIQNFKLIHDAVSERRVSLIAVLDEDVPKPEIVGVQKLFVDIKGNKLPYLPGNFIQKFFKLCEEIENRHNPFEIFGTDTIIRAYGLGVKPGYTGLAIGYNLVHSIEKLAKAFGIKAFAVYYSNIRSQKIGEKLGFEVLDEIVYDEYKDDQGQVVFPVQGTKSLKFMGIKYK